MTFDLYADEPELVLTLVSTKVIRSLTKNFVSGDPLWPVSVYLSDIALCYYSFSLMGTHFSLSPAFRYRSDLIKTFKKLHCSSQPKGDITHSPPLPGSLTFVKFPSR